MKYKLVIQAAEVNEAADEMGVSHSELWSGELDIKDQTIYIMKVSLIVEGKPEPLVDIPFATGVGHYEWIPPDPVIEDIDPSWRL